jgi:hypothetical protein
MGLLKRMAANHRARVSERQTRKASKRQHKTERKIAKYDHKNERQLDRLLHKDGRVHARLEKRGQTVADQDERDIANVFPIETPHDNNGGGYDSGEGSFWPTSESTPFSSYDFDPNFVQPDFDTTDIGSFDADEDSYDDDGGNWNEPDNY